VVVGPVLELEASNTLEEVVVRTQQVPCMLAEGL